MGTQTTLTISISITERYYLGHQETLFCCFCWYIVERNQVWRDMVFNFNGSLENFCCALLQCHVCCVYARKNENDGIWKQLLGLNMQKHSTWYRSNWGCDLKRNGRMNPLFVIVTRTPNVIQCLIRHVLSEKVLNHICGAHSVSNLQSPFPSPFDSLLLVFPFY